jgi:hypothetical protein
VNCLPSSYTDDDGKFMNLPPLNSTFSTRPDTAPFARNPGTLSGSMASQKSWAANLQQIIPIRKYPNSSSRHPF